MSGAKLVTDTIPMLFKESIGVSRRCARVEAFSKEEVDLVLM